MTKQFAPSDYVQLQGWDFGSIEETASLGVSDADEHILLALARESGLTGLDAEDWAADASDALLAYCRARAGERAAEPPLGAGPCAGCGRYDVDHYGTILVGRTIEAEGMECDVTVELCEECYCRTRTRARVVNSGGSDMHANSGQHNCPCRDCFEIAIGCDDNGNPDLCHECKETGCDASGESECNAPHAYGGSCDDPECCEPHEAGEGFETHGPGEWYRACPKCKR